MLQKFYGIVALDPPEGDDDLDDLARADTGDMDEDDDDDQDALDGDDSAQRPEQAEKRKKRHRLARLKRKTKLKAYEFNGLSDIAGVLFLEIQKVTDLPPERNSKSTLATRHDIPITLRLTLTCPSDTDIVRHGSICRELTRQEDIPYPSHQAQPQSYFRREAGLPSATP